MVNKHYKNKLRKASKRSMQKISKPFRQRKKKGKKTLKTDIKVFLKKNK